MRECPGPWGSGKVFCGAKRRAAGDPKPSTNYVARVSALLQKMSPPERREIICGRLSQKQRLALEAFLMEERKRQRSDSSSTSGSNPAPAAKRRTAPAPRQPAGRDTGRGIHKSAANGRLYGYYAQCGINNLMFFTRIQKELADAVKDHIVLARIVEQIRSDQQFSVRGFPGSVKAAVAMVLQEEGLSGFVFLRGVRVSFSANHWIGRNLFVHREQLDAGLVAWNRLHGERCPRLFAGSQPSAAYTPELARERWNRAREAFVELQAEQGRCERDQVEEALSMLEANRKADVDHVAMMWRRMQWERQQQQERQQRLLPGPEGVTAKCGAEALLQRMDKLLRSWNLVMAKECRCRARAERREFKARWQSYKERRWNGKESLAAFERRVRRQRIQRGM